MLPTSTAFRPSRSRTPDYYSYPFSSCSALLASPLPFLSSTSRRGRPFCKRLRKLSSPLLHSLGLAVLLLWTPASLRRPLEPRKRSLLIALLIWRLLVGGIGMWASVRQSFVITAAGRKAVVKTVKVSSQALHPWLRRVLNGAVEPMGLARQNAMLLLQLAMVAFLSVGLPLTAAMRQDGYLLATAREAVCAVTTGSKDTRCARAHTPFTFARAVQAPCAHWRIGRPEGVVGARSQCRCVHGPGAREALRRV